MATAIRRSCNYRFRMGILEAHLKKPTDDRLTQAQVDAHYRFEEAFNEWVRARKDAYKGECKLLEVSELCGPLNTSFFDGCHGNVEYIWMEPDDCATGTLLVRSKYGEGCSTSSISLEYDEHLKPCWRDNEIISTILHEMVHLYLNQYCCNGTYEHRNCRHKCQKPPTCSNGRQSRSPTCTRLLIHTDGSISETCSAKKSVVPGIPTCSNDLCSYMFARCIGLLSTAWAWSPSNDTILSVSTTEYVGHGPVFQRLMTAIQKNTQFILGSPSAIELANIPGERHCTCKETRPTCLAHCCDTFEEMQRSVFELF